MKLATQYDMLSYVGSEIDEVKMDHLTFFKIYNQLWNPLWLPESFEYKLEQMLEIDQDIQSLLTNIDNN